MYPQYTQQYIPPHSLLFTSLCTPAIRCLVLYLEFPTFMTTSIVPQQELEAFPAMTICPDHNDTNFGKVESLDHLVSAGIGQAPPTWVRLDAQDLNVVHASLAKLAIPEAADRIVFIEALRGTGRRFDVPFDESGVERIRNLSGEFGLSRARLSFHQKRSLETDCGIDGDTQIVGGDISLCALKLHD